MLKERIIRRILVITASLFIIIVLYTLKLIPNQKKEITNIYYSNSELTGVVYTIDEDNYVSKTNIYVNKETSSLSKIKELLEAMTNKTTKSELLKDNFAPILPTGTKVVDLSVNNGVLKINFSKQLLDISKELEEKMIESIVYTVTEFKDILGVEIYVENNILKYLPNSLQKLPTIITRDYGINKIYDINNLYNINEVILYYIKQDDDNIYYVPVTKYVNDKREKIEIIIDNLASNYIYEDNLASYLNSNAELINYNMKDEGIELYFNKYIFTDYEEEKILEEVIYTISQSVFANYDLNNIKLFVVNDIKESKLIEEIKR